MGLCGADRMVDYLNHVCRYKGKRLWRKYENESAKTNFVAFNTVKSEHLLICRKSREYFLIYLTQEWGKT